MESWTLWTPLWQLRLLQSPMGPAKQLSPARSVILNQDTHHALVTGSNVRLLMHVTCYSAHSLFA